MTNNTKCSNYDTCDYATSTHRCISDEGGLCRGDTRLGYNTSLHQCSTCKLEGKRSCMYHGYPASQISDSCSYKIGTNVEESLKNLNGTYIDIWTKEHDEEVIQKSNDELLTKLVQELAGTWRLRDAKLFKIIRKYRIKPIGAMKNATTCRSRKDCYNCGSVSCGYQMRDGCGVTTQDAVIHRKEIHNGKYCERWSEV